LLQLTVPIYETSTFVFDNAQELIAYNEGRSSKFLYSRYGNPTVAMFEERLRRLLFWKRFAITDLQVVAPVKLVA
jgi:O-acetylhomoserine/O-acetylserine sulfhydrylase-like pyridoxal-dependent enzyme